jgi:hypothetical protein
MGASFTVTRTGVGDRHVGPGAVDGSGLRKGVELRERAAHVAARFDPAGRCPAEPTINIAITDLSPSLGYGGNPGNDPAGLRHPALLVAARHVARACRCGREFIEVISFDLHGEFDIGPLSFNRADMRTLTTAMESTNYGSGCSTLGPALQTATRALAGWAGLATVTVMSDFELTDPDSISRLGDLPAHVHAVVFTSSVPHQLERLTDAGITVTTVAPTDPVEIVAHAIHHELTHHRPTSRRTRRSR